MRWVSSHVTVEYCLISHESIVHHSSDGGLFRIFARLKATGDPLVSAKFLKIVG